MRRLSASWARGRAIIGVIALYGLLLQAFLAAAHPVAMPDAGILCAEHEPASPGSDRPLHHDHQCCTAAQGAQLAPAPSSDLTAVPVPPAPARVAWRPEASRPRTGPPTHAHSARGPPAT